jgi:pimeloyl-ACP methyl ester carboxylesterase/predicted glycosyltransferase
MSTIDRVGRSDTETQARLPDEQGVVERDGVHVHWESFGARGRPAILLLPTWSVLHSRHWKGQIPYLARHFHVITFDGRGNGFSDRPLDPAAYSSRNFIADAVAVLDAAEVQRACMAGVSMGGLRALLMAAWQPERVTGAFLIDPTVPFVSPPPAQNRVGFDEELDHYEGWQKYNSHYWRRDYRGFLEFFFSQVMSDPHSTKQIEDCVAWGLDTTPEVLIATMGVSDPELPDRDAVEALCRGVTCPIAVVHGSDDQVLGPERGRRVAELTGAEFTSLVGAGHAPQGRHPVKVNLLLREFAERVSQERPPARQRTWTRALARHPRALYVSSPIGLGHAWRDVAIADALRRHVPGLEIQWLAQEPVTTVLQARGEHIHPASAELASEAVHIDREAGEHDLHAFEALRRMDDIFCANFMAFHDVVRDQTFDLWIADEAWELDHFLHENPELKTAPLAWLTDFVGYLPMPAGGEREALLTADYNAEMIEHVERFPHVRDRSIFVGDPEDVVPTEFGPGLPRIRDWTERHYDFGGYVLGFDPSAVPSREELRAELGYGPEPVCVISVGGSGVGAPMLHRVIEAVALAHEHIPELRTVAVAGPRIDPASLPSAPGLEVMGYVHELWRHLAACDGAVVQGGLTTAMELVAAGRPFITIPLESHFEQRFHVRHRLDRYGARDWLDFGDASPEKLADAITGLIGTEPSYRPVDGTGAERTASLIAELL